MFRSLVDRVNPLSESHYAMHQISYFFILLIKTSNFFSWFMVSLCILLVFCCLFSVRYRSRSMCSISGLRTMTTCESAMDARDTATELSWWSVACNSYLQKHTTTPHSTAISHLCHAALLTHCSADSFSTNPLFRYNGFAYKKRKLNQTKLPSTGYPTQR